VSDSEVQSEVHPLLEGLSLSADAYIRGNVARDAPYVPDRLRPSIIDISDRLATVLDALFEIDALCDDAAVLGLMAESQHPFGDISAYQAHRMFEAHKSCLDGAFPEALFRLTNAFNATLQAASADEEQIDLARIMREAGGGWQFSAVRSEHGSGVGRTDQPLGGAPYAEGRQLREWPPLARVSDHQQSELRRQLRDQHECMQAALTAILKAHGPALLELVDRHNAMMQNFERRSRE
jgi:hypothetical protein